MCGSQGIQHTDGNSRLSSPYRRVCSPSVLRRLAFPTDVPIVASCGSVPLLDNCVAPGTHSESVQVRPSSLSGFHLRGVELPDSTEPGQGQSFSGFGCPAPSVCIPQEGTSFRSFPSVSPRGPELSSGLCGVGSPSSLATSTLPPCPLASFQGSSLGPYSASSSLPPGSRLVVERGTSPGRSSGSSSCPLSFSDLGCQQKRVGAHVEPFGLLASGFWTPLESRLHINNLELIAVRRALSVFQSALRGHCVLVSTDNTTVVAYIRRQGGTHSLSLFQEVRLLLLQCQSLNITLQAKHLPGRLNVLADSLSMSHQVLPAEWSLHQEVANMIFLSLDCPMVDLFATRFNHRLPLYVRSGIQQRGLWIPCLCHGIVSLLMLPSVHTASCSSSEGQTFPVPCSSGGPSVVQRSPGPLVRPPQESPSQKRPSLSTRERSSRQPRPLQASRLAVIRDGLRKRKFSSQVASLIAKARRSSTSAVYNAKWKVFSDWCCQREIDPVHPSIQQIADFFAFLFEARKLAVSTIKGYRAMLSNTLGFRGLSSIGSNPFLSELIRSFELSRPVFRSLTPRWDLSCVLWSLTRAPFEPLDKATTSHLYGRRYSSLRLPLPKKVQ